MISWGWLRKQNYNTMNEITYHLLFILLLVHMIINLISFCLLLVIYPYGRGTNDSLYSTSYNRNIIRVLRKKWPLFSKEQQQITVSENKFINLKNKIIRITSFKMLWCKVMKVKTFTLSLFIARDSIMEACIVISSVIETVDW